MSSKEEELSKRISEFNKENGNLDYPSATNLSLTFKALGDMWTTSHGVEVVAEFQKIYSSMMEHRRVMQSSLRQFHYTRFSYSVTKDIKRWSDE